MSELFFVITILIFKLEKIEKSFAWASGKTRTRKLEKYHICCLQLSHF